MRTLGLLVLCVTAPAMLVSAPVRAAPSGPLTTASPAIDAIDVDGKLDENAWEYTAVASEMRILGTSTSAPRTTTFRFLYSETALYVGVHCGATAGSRRLLPEAKAKTRDGAVYGDESFELYLQPAGAADYFHLSVNLVGTCYDGRGFDKSWNGQWQARTSQEDDGWQAELELPFRTFGIPAMPAPGTTWRVNLARNDRINQNYHTWASLPRGFHEPQGFGSLLFSDHSVGIGPLQLNRRGRDVVLSLRVRAGAKRVADALQALIRLRTPSGQTDVHVSQELVAGTAQTIQRSVTNAWQPGTQAWLSYEAEVDGQPLYRAAPLTMPADSFRPERGARPVPVSVGNGTVALAFDTATGRLLSAQNKATGLSVAFGEAGVPILEIETVRFLKNPRTFRDEDVHTVVPDYETLVDVIRHDTPAGQTLLIEHRLQSTIPVRLRITVPPSGVETAWDIEIDNALTHHPSQSLVVHRVRYPHFAEIEEGSCGARPYVVTPMLMGQRFPEPGKNLGRQHPISYTGRATMGWFDFYGDRGGLYFKVGDIDPLPQTDLIVQSDPATRRLRLGIQRWALCWPGETWTPGPCGLGVHAGDWHSAADLYRTWFRETFEIMTPPTWLKDADGYVMSGGPSYEFADFPRVIENAKAIGIGYVELWSEMTGGDLSYHAFGLPNPYMGTEKELRKAIEDLHRAGGHIGFYLNFNTGDPLLGTFVRQPRLHQKIPKTIPRPAIDYMKDNWIQQSIMNHAGSYSTWNTVVPGYLDGYWNTCPSARKWTDFYYYWVVEKWAKEYKADVWYLDSCPVSRGSPCFAFDHGHTRPAPEGQGIIDFYKRLRAGAPKNFCIMQEYSSDRLLPYSTHALGLMWHPKFAHPEVVRYTFPEYPLFSGMCNGTAGMKQFYPGEALGPKDAIERVFLIGNRYEFPMSNLPPDLANDWARRMVALRRACRPEMNYGDFLDGIGIGPLPENVHARLFRRADRSRLALTLLDRRKTDRTPIRVSIDLVAAAVGAVRRVRGLCLQGELIIDPPQVDGGGTVITIPVYEDNPAAILIETGPQ